ncbi:hypothetical protein EV2_038754 [Malus domestica]
MCNSINNEQLKDGTTNFDQANRIGEGGLGYVYKAHLLKSEMKLMNLVDPRLGSEFNNEEMMATINVAILYCNSTSKLRATMYVVVSMFEEKATV